MNESLSNAVQSFKISEKKLSDSILVRLIKQLSARVI